MLNINPYSIVDGTLNKSQLKDMLVEQATVNKFEPMEELRFHRTISKAADNAASRKMGEDENGEPILLADLAVEQALTLPELRKALDDDKKEFTYKGCRYQYREEESVDLSTRSGEEAEEWKENRLLVADYEAQIAGLRTKIATAKKAMEGAETRYIAKHPTCKKTVKRSIVVL